MMEVVVGIEVGTLTYETTGIGGGSVNVANAGVNRIDFNMLTSPKLKNIINDGSSGWNSEKPFSFSFLFTVTEIASNRYFLYGQQEDGNQVITLQYTNYNKTITFRHFKNNGGAERRRNVVLDNRLELGQKIHIVVTYNGLQTYNCHRIYVDSVDNGTYNTSGGIGTTKPFSSLRIGGASADQGVGGTLDQFKFWDILLSQEQVNELYQKESIDNVDIENYYPLSVDDFTVDRLNDSTRVNKDGFIEAVASSVPRLDSSDGGCPTLLVEPSRENLILNHEFGSGNWGKTTASQWVEKPNEVSPDGSVGLTEWHSSGNNNIFYPLGDVFVANEINTYSFYHKFVGGNQVRVTWNSYDDVACSPTFYPNGTVSLDGAQCLNATCEPFGSDGWYFCTVTVEMKADVVGNIRHTDSANSGLKMQIWGVQSEVGEYATSRILTNGTAKTRGVEQVHLAGDSTSFNSVEGIMYAEMRALNNDDTSRFIGLRNSDGSNAILLGYGSFDDNIQCFVVQGGSYVWNGGSQGFVQTDYHKIAIKWKLNDWQVWVDGVEIASNNALPTFTVDELTTLGIAETGNSVDWYGHLKALKVMKGSDYDMQELTTSGNFVKTYNTVLSNASSFITSESDLASKISIGTGNIADFIIDGNDVKCNILSPYNILNNAFQGLPITKWKDDNGLIRVVGADSMRTSTLQSFETKGITYISIRSFYQATSLAQEFIAPNLITINGNSPFVLAPITKFVAENLENIICNDLFRYTRVTQVIAPKCETITGINNFRQLNGGLMQILDLRGIVGNGLNGVATESNVFGSFNPTQLTAYFPIHLQTNNGGGEDGDIALLRSNGATIVYI